MTPNSSFSVQLPVMIISHGVNGKNIDLDWLQQSLAKSGYLTVAIQHDRKNGCGGLPIPPNDPEMIDRNTDVDNVVNDIVNGNFISALNSVYSSSHGGATLSRTSDIGLLAIRSARRRG